MSTPRWADMLDEDDKEPKSYEERGNHRLTNPKKTFGQKPIEEGWTTIQKQGKRKMTNKQPKSTTAHLSTPANPLEKKVDMSAKPSERISLEKKVDMSAKPSVKKVDVSANPSESDLAVQPNHVEPSDPDQIAVDVAFNKSFEQKMQIKDMHSKDMHSKELQSKDMQNKGFFLKQHHPISVNDNGHAVGVVWSQVQRYLPSLLFCAEALRHPQHPFAGYAMLLQHPSHTPPVVDVITMLGQDIEMLQIFHHLIQQLGPKWWMSACFGGPVSVRVSMMSPEAGTIIQRFEQRAFAERWVFLNLTDVVQQSSGWISAITVFPKLRFSVLLNHHVRISSLPDSNGVVSIAVAKQAMLQERQHVPDMAPFFPSMLFSQLSAVTLVFDQTPPESLNVSLFDSIASRWFSVDNWIL